MTVHSKHEKAKMDKAKARAKVLKAKAKQKAKILK